MAVNINEVNKKFSHTHKGVLIRRYIEMKRESKKYGLRILDKISFSNWSMEISSKFPNLNFYWYRGGCKRELTPVIERRDKRKDFVLGNIKWVYHKDKNRISGRPIVLIRNRQSKTYHSSRRAELAMNFPHGVLSRAMRTSGKYKGYRVKAISNKSKYLSQSKKS